MAFFNKCCFCVPLELGCLIVAWTNLIGSILAIVATIYTLKLGTMLYGTHTIQEDRLSLILIGLSIVLILTLISLTFTIVLMVGINKKKPGHVKAYLIFSLVFLILFAILIIVRAVTGLGVSFDGIVNFLANIYFILVIRSYHMKMLEDKDDNVQKV